MKNRTKFNWQCVHCGKRNIQTWRFQFDVPKIYNATVFCQKCGKESSIEFCLTIEAVTTTKLKKDR